MYRLFCREKSRLEKSRVPSLSFFCCLHQGNPKKSAQFGKSVWFAQTPPPQTSCLKRKWPFLLAKNRYRLWGIIFHCGMIFQFPISKQEHSWLVAENCVRDDPGFFKIFGQFWVGHYHIIQQIIQCGTAWGLLRLFLNRPASKKYKLFNWGLPGLRRTSEQNPRSPKIASWKRGRGYGVTSRGCWMGIDLATNSSFFFECCQSWGGWGFLNFSISPEIQVFLALIIL